MADLLPTFPARAIRRCRDSARAGTLPCHGIRGGAPVPVPGNGLRPFGLPGRIFFPRGAGSRPSRWAFLRASLRARRTASPCSRVAFSEGFSKNLLRFISRNTPSRCIFFLRTRSAWSMLLSRTSTCKKYSLRVVAGRVVASRVVAGSIQRSELPPLAYGSPSELTLFRHVISCRPRSAPLLP